MNDLSGFQLGPYVLERELSSSGGVRVFVGQQVTLGRKVIVKVLNPTTAVDPVAVERFKREASTVARLRHPHIVTVHDFGEEAGLLYIATEYVEGGSLADRLTQPLPLVTTYLIVSQIASALDYAHNRGVVHRNVKPGNLLLVEKQASRPIWDPSYQPWVLLSDFSLAKVEGAQNLTQVGVGVGTPYYMSPEQTQGRPVDGASDIYSLGIVTFELLTNRVPFGGASAVEVAMKHLEEPLPSVRLVIPELPPAVDRVLERATSKIPQDRYATAGEFADDLARAAGIEPSSRAPLASTGESGRLPAVSGFEPDDDAPPPQRRWLIPVLAGAAALIIVCCMISVAGAALNREAIGIAVAATTPTPTATQVSRITATATPNPRDTPTPTTTPDANVDLRAVIAAVEECNKGWLAGVNKGGAATALSAGCSGVWLQTLTNEVTGLREKGEYVRGTITAQPDQRSFTINAGKDSATIRVTESYALTKHNAATDAALSPYQPGNKVWTYTVTKQGNVWKVSEGKS